MDIEKPQAVSPGVPTSTRGSWLDKLQLYLNTINHMLIAVVAFYTLWLCPQMKPDIYASHTWLCTLGYNVLMAESLMALYNRNSWTGMHTRRTNIHIHWILQAIGCTFALAGMLLLYIKRGFYISSTHAITGFIANIFIVIGVINGSSALWATELRLFIKPVMTKLIHNITGCLCFIFGMIALWHGFVLYPFYDQSSLETVAAMQGICCITAVLSMIGAIQAMWGQLTVVFPTFGRVATFGRESDF